MFCFAGRSDKSAGGIKRSRYFWPRSHTPFSLSHTEFLCSDEQGPPGRSTIPALSPLSAALLHRAALCSGRTQTFGFSREQTGFFWKITQLQTREVGQVESAASWLCIRALQERNVQHQNWAHHRKCTRKLPTIHCSVWSFGDKGRKMAVLGDRAVNVLTLYMRKSSRSLFCCFEMCLKYLIKW